MALTVTTGLTVLSTAESTTNWVSYGSGGAGAMAIEPDFFVQGSNCISRGVSGTTRKGQMYNHAAGVNFTSGTDKDKLVYVWMRTSTPGLCNTRAAGGQTIILGSGTTTPADAAGVWSMWYVDGSDSIIETNGFTCYVVDPQSTASATFGGGVNTAAITYFGGTQLSTTTAKGQNFGVDQIAYGRGEVFVSGTVATTGEGFKEIAAVVYDSAKTNRWGIITVRAGIFFVRGKIIIGHGITNTSANWTVAVASNVVTVETITPHNLTTNSVFSTNASWTNNAFMASLSGKTVASIPTATSFTFALTQGNQGATTETNTAANIGANTNFSSRSETVVFETPGYYNGTNVVQSIPNASVGATAGSDGKTSYLGLAYRGGAGTTTINIGVIVGSDSGRSGSNFSVQTNTTLTTPAKTLATVTVDSSTMGLSQYATAYLGFEGAINLGGTGTAGDDAFATTFNGCSNITANVELDNSFILSPVVVANTSALIWNDNTNPNGLLDGLTFTKGTNAHHAIEFGTNSPLTMTLTGIDFSGFSASQNNDASIFHIKRTSGAETVTINLIGCSSDVSFATSYRTDGANVSIVQDPVTFSVTVKDLDTGAVIENARVMVPVTSAANFPYNASVSIAGSGTTATVTHATHGLATNDNILIAGAIEDVYNGAYTITLDGVDPDNKYTYTAPDTLPASASGSPTATMVLLNGDTNASGVITDSRTYSADQTVSGWVRRHTYGPSYTSATWTESTSTLTKTGAFTGLSGTFLLTITAGTNMTPGIYLATYVNANDVTLPGGAGSADSSNVAFTIGAKPLYRQAPVVDSIPSSAGKEVTVFLQPDE
jgi:hypothetical protein